VQLREETGIDNGLRRCGGLHLAGDESGLGRLAETAGEWRRRGARAELLSAGDVAADEPAFAAAVERGRIVGAMLLPDEMQIHSARHLEAVAASCRLRGVSILEGQEVRSIASSGGRIDSVETASDTITAAHWVLAAGAHSEKLAPALGLSLSTRPIRGQIALLNPGRVILSRIVNHGLDYMLQREDGRLLVGSTIEDVGFDPSTTPEVIARLLAFARELVSTLAHAPVEHAWAGLRPGSADGLPTIGAIPGLDNAFVAAGHFRAGVHQSTGTAVIVADLVMGLRPSFPCGAFAVDRRIDRSAAGGIDDYLARAAIGR
jgi:glycine oxidase